MSQTTTYEYSGYLSAILRSPKPDAFDGLDSVTFTHDDLAAWRTEDFPYAAEWRQVSVTKSVGGDGVTLEGDFRNVQSIDGLSENSPRYWVPLSTIGLEDPRLPIDTRRYPIIEVTYRCLSSEAHPCWLWSYERGSHFGSIPHTDEWRTVARNVQHFGFPDSIENVVLRLYSPTRTVESMEIAQVRFREMTAEEREAMERSLEEVEQQGAPRHFPVLDEFMPLGVYMDAQSARRLAAMLGISAHEYWELVLEDIVAHHHNCVALANADRLDSGDFKSLLDRFERAGVRMVVRHDYPLDGTKDEQERHLADHVAPYADSDVIFARAFSGEPVENNFHDVIAAKQAIETADSNHPVALVARYPNAYPLFAHYFSASGVGHFATRRPWDMGRTVRSHEPLAHPQQFWAAAPAFVYPTQTPEWSTCPEMRLMVNLSFANGARGWFAYSYHNDPLWLRGMVQRSLTGPFLTFSDLWLELAQRMRRADAIAPLLMRARAEDTIEEWYDAGVTTDTTSAPRPEITPMSQFHLRGDDFSLYLTVSNNTRDMTSVNVSIPSGAVDGREIYDLSKYITTLNWEPLSRNLHIEMFPGQSHIVMVAKPDVGAHWRDVIASRIIAIDLRLLDQNLELARAYGMKSGRIEKRVDRFRESLTPDQMGQVHKAKDDLVNLIYGHADLSRAQNYLSEASSAICASDGGLCRLIVAGKRAVAERIGTEVLPLARELLHLRLEVRGGNAAALEKDCETLRDQCLDVLARIRAEYPRPFSGAA